MTSCALQCFLDGMCISACLNDWIRAGHLVIIVSRSVLQFMLNFGVSDLRARSQYCDLVHQVLQFTYVSWPGIRLEQMQCLLRKLQMAILLSQEVLRQSGDVFDTLAEWWHANLELAEAMVKILAESSGLDFFLQIAVGGSHHTHI